MITEMSRPNFAHAIRLRAAFSSNVLLLIAATRATQMCRADRDEHGAQCDPHRSLLPVREAENQEHETGENEEKTGHLLTGHKFPLTPS